MTHIQKNSRITIFIFNETIDILYIYKTIPKFIKRKKTIQAIYSRVINIFS